MNDADQAEEQAWKEFERRQSASIDAILTERGRRYGTFIEHAEISLALKNLMRHALHQRGKILASDQQEALDMIAHKLARIINGDPNYADSWTDVSGYAQLVADRLQGITR